MNFKHIIILIVVLAVIGTGIFFITKSKDDLVSESKKDVKKNNLTYDDFVYKQIASSLREAFSGWGTDEEAVYRNIQKIKNKDDWKMLISVYGIDDKGMNLVERLINELDSSEISIVNQTLLSFNESI